MQNNPAAIYVVYLGLIRKIYCAYMHLPSSWNADLAPSPEIFEFAFLKRIAASSSKNRCPFRLYIYNIQSVQITHDESSALSTFSRLRSAGTSAGDFMSAVYASISATVRFAISVSNCTIQRGIEVLRK